MDILTFFLKTYMQEEAYKQRAQSLKQEAIEEVKKKLQIAAETGKEEAQAGLLINLGNIYAYYSDFTLSDTMYRQALAIAREITDKQLEAIALINLGLSYKVRMDYPSAYSYYQRAIKITREVGNQKVKQKILEHIDELSNMINIEKLSKE
jgi:tetratricopeptide (TPR) repeat protein